MPAAFSRHVREGLPQAEQVTIERCGHVPQVERPAETNSLLLDFFRRAERGEAVRPGGERTLHAGADRSFTLDAEAA